MGIIESVVLGSVLMVWALCGDGLARRERVARAWCLVGAASFGFWAAEPGSSWPSGLFTAAGGLLGTAIAFLAFDAVRREGGIAGMRRRYGR